MNQKKQFVNPMAVLVCLLLLVAGIIFLICNSGHNNNAMQVSNTQNDMINDIPTMHVSGLLAKKTLEDLVLESNLIVQGVVDSVEPAIQVESVSGDIMNFTEYLVNVNETFQGESFKSIKIRLKGGIANDLNVVCEDSPKLSAGEEYVFFLYKPDCGSGYNTEGDYYYLTGGPQGLRSVNGSTARGVAPISDDTTAEVPVANLLGKIEEYQAGIPAGSTFSLREQFIENLNINLETGFITQEEYDSMLAEIDQYAVIVSD